MWDTSRHGFRPPHFPLASLKFSSGEKTHIRLEAKHQSTKNLYAYCECATLFSVLSVIYYVKRKKISLERKHFDEFLFAF